MRTGVVGEFSIFHMAFAICHLRDERVLFNDKCQMENGKWEIPPTTDHRPLFSGRLYEETDSVDLSIVIDLV
jgi:hypothetical protein